MHKICYDRLLPTPKARIIAAKMSALENPDNRPKASLGPISPLGLALLTDKKWATGRLLTCHFLEGSATQRCRIEEKFHDLEEFANIKFKFENNIKADIRIALNPDGGGWSYVGNDILYIRTGPTMNLGWIFDDTHDSEYKSLVYHELCHSLGMIHEHSSPSGGIKWNKPVVYAALAKSPNFWDVSTVDSNVFELYSAEVTQFSAFDPFSVMLYSFDPTWTLDGFSAPWNHELSTTDKKYLRKFYPFSDVAINGQSRRLSLPINVVKQLNLIVSPDEADKLYRVEMIPDRGSWLSLVLPSGVHAFGKNPIDITLPAGKTVLKARNENVAGTYDVSVKLVG